ncbi:hypothetical protein BO70DRAFT_341059 [Aspergillus heteromorphus CBS 117.55]|uniref:AhpC/TSA antioxidant enzyme-domain-containing protein n=1 Tax=Aspergillus heteromorphus CBS 117.55 TaxID=1448321 RepID=A0A317VL26_9EURO|nr:uncharacterized protein BO70DRAFT_341059 [Aspergillus heteromorphus CBS 117.55]PWY74269.1 hypothetical protein BO70DRAFT_341059 [Aspergillus heteromorphus CBS 117.55]
MSDTAAVPESKVQEASAASDRESFPPAPTDIAGDFQGEVNTDDQLPSAETLDQVASYTVLDREHKEHSFRDLYAGVDAAPRTLVIFVRHFFCGSCQEYLRSLSDTITPDFLAQLPTRTAVVIVGCGDPGLIDHYAAETGCPFPIYSDPTAQLYEALGMVSSLALGPRPAYIRKGMARIVAESVWQALKYVPSGLATKAGDSRQIGGEFLFESDPSQGEGKDLTSITWCHRMKTTRDHSEVSVLASLLQR